MSDSRYSYDENSEVWPYFVITLAAVVTVPLSIVAYGRLAAKQDPHSKATYDLKDFKPANAAEITSYRTRSKRSKLFTKLNFFLALGWLLIGTMVLLVSTSSPVANNSVAVFDPYVILDLPLDASEKDIKTQYRQYTLKFHPDKVRTLEGNMTQDDVEARFVAITKAYKTLTDPEVRENYQKYGHPDGPQETFHGIALPKFLVDGKGSSVVVGFYVLFFAVVLPYIVGRWWSATQVYTKTGVHRDTAGLFFETLVKDQPQFVLHEKILELLSDAEEFRLLYPGIEKETVIKLIQQHLNRQPSANDAEETQKVAIVVRAPVILDGFLDIASAFKFFPLCLRIIEVRRCIVQAVSLEARLLGAELAQLPGASAAAVTNSNVRKLSEFVAKNKSGDSAAIAEVEKVIGASNASVAKTALQTARNIPRLHILDAYFKTPGEDVVPPKSQSHVVVRYVLTTQDVDKLPEISKDEIREDETMALVRNPMLTNNKGPLFPSTLAPYFAGEENPSWSLFLFTGPQAFLEGPTELSRGYLTTAADIKKYISDKESAALTEKKKKPTKKSEEEDEEDELIVKPTVKVEDQTIKINTVKIQLSSMTPENEGKYNFVLQFVSKDYYGQDHVQRIEVSVENPPAEPTDNDEYDIPDPDEDSLAGAISQIQGRPVRRAEAKPEAEDDDDEDEEEEEDLSDIDTDTDAEFSSDEEDDEDFKTK